MAIAFVHRKYINRQDSSAAKKLSYNCRTLLECSETGKVHNYSGMARAKLDYNRRHGICENREDLLYHKVMLPEGASEKFRDIGFLAEKIEQSEKRKNARLMREDILALPREGNLESWKELIDKWTEPFLKEGRIVVVNIHHPSEKEIASLKERYGDEYLKYVNPHAHIIATTRTAVGENLTSKIRDFFDLQKRSL